MIPLTSLVSVCVRVVPDMDVRYHMFEITEHQVGVHKYLAGVGSLLFAANPNFVQTSATTQTGFCVCGFSLFSP